MQAGGSEGGCSYLSRVFLDAMHLGIYTEYDNTVFVSIPPSLRTLLSPFLPLFPSRPPSPFPPSFLSLLSLLPFPARDSPPGRQC